MQVATKELVYQAARVPLTGYLAWDETRPGQRPGVLVVHEWWGHNDYVRRRAEALAGEGYVALALDMYGAGKVASDPKQAGELMTAVLSDPATLRQRFEAAREVLAADPHVDRERLAAVGYCFGGVVVLEMARAGLALRAVAAFHPGGLATRTPARRGHCPAKVLVCLGTADPFVSVADQAAFRREMNQAGVEHELVLYPDVQHGFTVPAASERGRKYGLPLAYDPEADADSWARLQRLLGTALT